MGKVFKILHIPTAKFVQYSFQYAGLWRRDVELYSSLMANHVLCENRFKFVKKDGRIELYKETSETTHDWEEVGKYEFILVEVEKDV